MAAWRIYQRRMKSEWRLYRNGAGSPLSGNRGGGVAGMEMWRKLSKCANQKRQSMALKIRSNG